MKTHPLLRSIPPAAVLACLAGLCAAQTGAGGPVSALPALTIIGTLPNRLEAVPGSSYVVTNKDLEATRPYSIREALQGVPGLHVVGEDAFGNNLNIGIRGLDPRRTSRTLLLEDGMPIHLAPYSDPSAHYHTPLERLQRVEVIKGSGQIVHGPQTVGGVINFITRDAPSSFSGAAEAAFGNRNYSRLAANVGTGSDRYGVMVDASERRGDGSREGNRHVLRDVQLKGRVALGAAQTLRVKLGYFEEDSKFGEAGLDQARFAANPYANPFRNDVFELERTAAQAVHSLKVAEGAELTTNLYYQQIDRASYRQIDAISEDGENETLRDNVGGGAPDIAGCPPDIDFTVPNGFEQFAPACGNAMRPRSYEFYGIEPRLELSHNAFGLRSELIAGLRLHHEDVTRRRFNGAFPTARENSPGTALRDIFEIETRAIALFAQNTFYAGNFTVTPGLRYERYKQTNRATQFDFAPADQSISETQSKLLPGVGATWYGLPGTTLFAGVHRGFAPPRPDANLDPSVVIEGDTFVPVDPEVSTNVELGARINPREGVQAEATLFQIQFNDQIVPGQTVGLAQTFANAGRSKSQGIELAGRVDLGRLRGAAHNFYVGGSYTHLFTAEFDSDLIVDGVNVRGNRLPYAPRHLATLNAGFEHASGWDARIGVHHVGRQFSDALNTEPGSPDGQSGVISDHTILNATVNYRLPSTGVVLYLSGTNLTDEVIMVSRVNGIHVGAPRQFNAGARFSF